MIIKMGHDIDEGAMLGMGAEAGRASLRRRSNEGGKRFLRRRKDGGTSERRGVGENAFVEWNRRTKQKREIGWRENGVEG